MFDLTNGEVLSVFLFVEVLGEWIYSIDSELSSIGLDNSSSFDLIASEEVVSNEILARLVHLRFHG